MDRRATAGALALALALVSSAVLGSCRGDLGPPLSDWRTKADDVCKAIQDEADKTRPVLFEQSLAQTLRKSSDYSKDEAQQLRALDKPADQRDKVRDYLASLDDRNRELDLLAAQAEHPGIDFKPPSLDSLATETQKASDLAQSLGLQTCRAGIDVSVGGSSPSTTAAPAPGANAPPGSAPNPTDLNLETQDQSG